MNPRAPQTNPNLLSTQKHINSDWVRVCYFSGARKRNSRRREARKRVGLNSFLSMKKGMANYYYLCLAITWFFLLKKKIMLKCSIRPCGGGRGETTASIASHGILFQFSSFLPELFIYCVALFWRVLRRLSETVTFCYNLFVSLFKRQYCVMKGSCRGIV